LAGALIEFVSAVVARPRKREVRLVVPAKYSAYTDDFRVATLLLSSEILKIKNKYSHFEQAKVIKQPVLK